MELGSEYHLSLSSLCKADYDLFQYLSEFETVRFYDSGRSAIKVVSAALDRSERVLLPEFICESVINCFDGDSIDFYHLNSDFSVDIESLKNKMTKSTRLIFLMHYFGAVQPKNVLSEIRSLAEKNSCIVLEDTTHSIFSAKRTIGDYVVASVRKWMPIAGGGVLYTLSDKLDLGNATYKKDCDNKRLTGMVMKDLFLHQGLECNKEYREIFKMCEESLDERIDIFQISDFSRFIISCMDIHDIIARRQSNYRYLLERLRKIKLSPEVEFEKTECPLVLPVRIKNRDAVRHLLMEHKVYCAVHWPFDGLMQEDRNFAKKNAEELISLPIDQRYSEKDMDYLADVLAECRGEIIC